MQKINEKLYNWASLLDMNAQLQAERTARLPIVERVALMPDAHLGMGATVGSVIATNGAVIPAAVGVDIGCGMAAVEFDLTADDLPDDLEAFLPMVERAIPAGVGQGHDDGTNAGRQWLKDNVGKFTTDLRKEKLDGLAVNQLGSLGSGNHFFEVCLDDRDHVWIVLHSGSRGIGNKLATRHIKEAKALAADRQTFLEDKDLAYFSEEDEGFDLYIGDMLACQDWAMANRQVMLKRALAAFNKFMGRTVPIVQTINCHHNFTALERHCLTCSGTGSPDNAGLGLESRKGEQLSRVRDFLDGCRIDLHSCGGLTLLDSQADRVLPPSLAGALVRSLRCLPEGALGAELGRSLELSRDGHPYGSPGTPVGTRTSSHSLESKSSELAPLVLDELETLSRTQDMSAGWSFVGASSLTSFSNGSTSCGGSDPTHDVRDLWITRKGAIKADVGDKGIIPGSMGTRSYIVSGLGNSDSFCSCSHGAGRIHSRSAAKRLFTEEDLEAAMEGKVWNRSSATALVDEIPGAYKDIDVVMKDQEDLVSTDHVLRQILNFKGM
jgi:RNA-splicing ligase RtcB